MEATDWRGPTSMSTICRLCKQRRGTHAKGNGRCPTPQRRGYIQGQFFVYALPPCACGAEIEAEDDYLCGGCRAKV